MSEGIKVTTVNSDSDDYDDLSSMEPDFKPQTESLPRQRHNTTTTTFNSPESSMEEDHPVIAPSEDEDESIHLEEEEEDDEDSSQDNGWVPTQLTTTKEGGSFDNSSDVSDISEEGDEADDESSEVSSSDEDEEESLDEKELENDGKISLNDDDNTDDDEMLVPSDNDVNVNLNDIPDYSDDQAAMVMNSLNSLEEGGMMTSSGSFPDDAMMSQSFLDEMDDDDIYNLKDKKVTSTEFLQPLEPPIPTAKEKGPMVFASEMLAMRYEDENEDMESTKQQAPLESPFAKARKLGTVNQVIDSNHHQKEIKKRTSKKEKDEEEEGDEEKKRSELMAWRREGIPEYIEFEFGKDDCPTDDEKDKDKSSKKQTKKVQVPARRILNPPPPPPTPQDSDKPATGGTPVQATPVNKNKSRMPDNARDMSGKNGIPPKKEETKVMQNLYQKARIRANKYAEQKEKQEEEKKKQKEKEKKQQKEKEKKQQKIRSVSPIRLTKGQSFKTKSTAETKHEHAIPASMEHDPAKFSTKSKTPLRMSNLKKGGAKKLKSLRKLMHGTTTATANTDQRDYRSTAGDNRGVPSKLQRGFSSSSIPNRASGGSGEPVMAVPLKRVQVRNIVGGNILRRTNTQIGRDTSIDENPFTPAAGGGRKGRRNVGSKSASMATGNTQPPPQVKAPSPSSMLHRKLHASFNGSSSAPMYRTPPMKTNSVRVKTAPESQSMGARGRRAGPRTSQLR